jgi:MYXO-CTERM domain-containing protein
MGFVGHAQIPTVLTDKISKGSGTIDLLQDVSVGGLESYFDANGTLSFAVDVNEAVAGNETSDSVGVAIKQMELVLTTTAGTFTFSDVYTSTTASILEAGATEAQDFYTLFGRTGSSSITGGTSDPNLEAFDDVVQIQNVAYEGAITGAELNVTFLDTAATSGDTNESFFDYSNGFEEFALITAVQSADLESADYGLKDAPETVTFVDEGALYDPPAAPAPPMLALLVLGALLVLRSRSKSSPSGASDG